MRIEVDLRGHRRVASLYGSIFGGLAGLTAGGVLAVFAGPLGADLLGTLGAAVGGTLTVGGGLASGIAGGLAIARTALRKRLDSARDEVEALLDRLQNGERLDPPPAPWRRRRSRTESPATRRPDVDTDRMRRHIREMRGQGFGVSGAWGIGGDPYFPDARPSNPQVPKSLSR